MSSASRYPEYQAHMEAKKKNAVFKVPGDRQVTTVDAQGTGAILTPLPTSASEGHSEKFVPGKRQVGKGPQLL